METLNYMFTNLLLPLFVGGIGAFAYPGLESYLKNRSISSRQRKLNGIIKDYRLVKKLRQNPNEQASFGIGVMMLFLGMITILIGLIGVFLIIDTPSAIIDSIEIAFVGGITFYTVNELIQVSSILRYCRDFDDYIKETVAKLSKLGSNPEDLDKLETE